MISLKNLLKEESFTAINKDSGEVSVFKTKDARDSAIKAGTHDKQDSKSAKGGDSPTDKKDVPKVNIFNKDKKDKSSSSKPSKSFSDNDIEDALESSTELDDFLDDNKSKFSKDDFETLKDYKTYIQQLEGDIVDSEMDDDTEQQEKYESELESEISKVKDILDKYKTTSSKKDTSQKSNTSNDDVKNFLSNKGEHEIVDFRKLGSSLKDKFTPKQEKEYNNLLNTLGKANYDDVPSDIKNAKDGIYDFIAGIEEPKKDDKPKDSTGGRAGNPEVNKAVRKKAESLGITSKKLGKEEYESRMSKAAVEALTDANFHSEARKLIAVLEDKPEWANDPRKDPKMPDVMSPEYEKWQKTSVYSSTFYDSAEGTDDLAHAATGEAGWDGVSALDAIAFDLKMSGSKKLAAKIQGIIDDTNESTTSLRDLLPESVQINEGTRSQVGVIGRNGKIVSAYVHYDGYPSNMKPGLKKHMKNEKDVLKLIKMGGARGIFDDKEIEYYKGGKPTKGDMKDFGGYVDAADRSGMAEFVYLYNIKDKKWYFADVYGDKKLKKLY